jgi:hypothetical protein
MNISLPIRLPGRLQDSQLWLRLVIVLGILLLSAFLARRPSERFILLPLAVVAGLILLRWPRLGLLALLIGSMVVPFSIGTGTGTPLNITVLLIPVLLAVWLADMTRRHEFRLVASRTTWPALALVASATVSLIAGGLPWNPFARTAPIMTQLGGWSVFAFSAAAFLLVANQVTDERWLKILTALFLVIGGLYMLGRVNPVLDRLSTMMNDLGSDGSMFWIWLVALASGQLLFNRKLNWVLQLALAAGIVLTLGIGWFLARGWASGYLPPMVALMTILWLRSWRLGLLVAIAGALFVLIGSPHLLDSLIGTESYSVMTRDVAREILLEDIFPLSPILGLGPANYYWYTPLYPILGWYVSFNSHNNYVDILLQTGVVGLACFSWFVLEVGWLGWRLRKSFANDFAQGYIYACLGGLVGTLVSAWLADWILPFAYNIGLRGFRASVLAWFFLGGLVSLEQIARQAKAANTH